MSLVEPEDGVSAGISGLVGATYARDAVADRFGRPVWERALPFDARYMKKVGPEGQGLLNFRNSKGALGPYGELAQQTVYKNWGNLVLPSEPQIFPKELGGKFIKPDIPILRPSWLPGRGSKLIYGEAKTTLMPRSEQIALAKKPSTPRWRRDWVASSGYTPNQVGTYPTINRGGTKVGGYHGTELDNALDSAKDSRMISAKPSTPIYSGGYGGDRSTNKWRNLKVGGTETGRWGSHIVPTPRLAGQILADHSNSMPVKLNEHFQTVAEKGAPLGKAAGTAQWAATKVTGIPSRAGAWAGQKVANTELGKATVGKAATSVQNIGLAAAKSAPVSVISKAAGSPIGKVGGKLLGPVATGLAIKSDVAKGESVKKAVVTNGIGLGASIAAGAAVGTMIPVPVVGTVAGAVVGAGVGIVATGAAKKGWDWTANKTKNLFGKKKMADGGPVLGAGSSIGDMIPAMLSHGEYVVNAASAGRFKPLLESINKGLPGFAPTGMNPAMSSVLEKASSGFGDAANAFVSGQSGDVMKTFGLKDAPAAMKAGTQAAELLKSVGPQLGSLAGSAAKQVIPAKALVASAMAKGGAVDQSMTINLQTPDLDTAFQKSKTLEAQRALTYAGRW